MSWQINASINTYFGIIRRDANYNIGAMYYANKVFIISIVLTIGLHIFLGWIPKASVVISLMLSIACISFSFFDI